MYKNLFESIASRKARISVVGLGYVGLPLAIAFAKKADVVGFDISEVKIKEYLNNHDVTKEVGDQAVQNTTVFFTADEKWLRDCKFHVVAVPTPINKDKTPDLRPLIAASKTVGRNLTAGSVVVFESTVFPGVTEDICAPILEKESGLQYGTEFKVGYSPERINPGDQVHRLETVAKVVSAMDLESLDIVAEVYKLIIAAGVYRAESIKVAEAAKVIENSQRDINIAFMNELSIKFNRLGIDTKSVLEAAGTKWNFLRFTPGLVGGHCIGVDPYYLTYLAEELGYHSQIILSGRKINDDMGKYVAENTVKKMIQTNNQIKGAKVAILGITFKENCPDSRNTKVIDIITELREYGIQVQVVDPVANAEEVKKEYGIDLCRLDEVKGVAAVIVAVAHNHFATLTLQDMKAFYKAGDTPDFGYEEVAATCEEDSDNTKQVLIDVKGIFDRQEAQKMNYLYWRL